MQFRTFARRAVGVLASGLIGASALAATAPIAAADEIAPKDGNTADVGYLAQAYGSYIYTADRKISSGPTAYTGVACTATAPRKSTNNTAAVNVPGIAKIGATETSVQTIDKLGVKSANATSETASASLLAGLIEVGAINAETTASKSGDEFSAEHSSQLASLKLLGQEIDVEAGPNSKIELRLPLVGTIGYIELNKQEERMVGDEFRAATTAVHVAILEDAEISNNAFVSQDQKSAHLLPGKDISLMGGTHIWIGQTRAHLQPPQSGYLNGEGFASQVKLLDGIVHSGKTSVTGVPCDGGASNNSVADVNIPGLLSLGAAKSSAEGEVGDDQLTSEVVTEIGASTLLGGLIELEAIKSVATATQATDPGAPVEVSADGTKLLGLKIDGEPVAETKLGPNSVIDLGVAKVTLNKQVERANSIAVTALEIELLDEIAGLPTGSLIEVGHARAGIGK